MSKKPKSSGASEKVQKKQRLNLGRFLGALAVSLIVWLWYRPNHILFASDTENYFRGLEGLLKDGIFSDATNLYYWPSGYPILMWPFATLTLNYFAFIVGTFQILFFIFSIYYFVIQLQHTIFNRLFWPISLFLSFNPTLALNAPAIGYEVNVASCFLLALGAFLKFQNQPQKNLRSREIWYAATAFSIATFMQPRISILALSFFLIWSLAEFKLTVALLMILSTSFIVAIGPLFMIARNLEANNFAAVSTNLGTTMNIGAGPQSTGGYTNKATGVPCPQVQGNAAMQDSHLIRCVLKWYKEHPRQTVALFMRKFQYHWSPWFGPLANGTTARSPWLDIHPLNSTIQTKEGAKFVFGNAGILISWIWIIGSMALMLMGFKTLWQIRGLPKVLATLLLVPVMLNSASSIVTIGDNRFRIPTLTLSLLLQLFGAYSLLASRQVKNWSLSQPDSTWESLNWKKNSEKDSLPT
jgi:hypothetical protein